MKHLQLQNGFEVLKYCNDRWCGRKSLLNPVIVVGTGEIQPQRMLNL